MGNIICTLDANINTCPFYGRDNAVCNSESPCSFWKKEEDISKSQYVRKERWYEKYYRNGSTKKD